MREHVLPVQAQAWHEPERSHFKFAVPVGDHRVDRLPYILNEDGSWLQKLSETVVSQHNISDSKFHTALAAYIRRREVCSNIKALVNA